KLAICIKKENEPKITQSELAKWTKDEFKLDKVPGQLTTSDILKKNKLMGRTEHNLDSKKLRKPALPELRKIITC
ncbi:hypothetical protein BDA99DRAFT_437771, partial [Phascolomyces articulosus]